MVGSSLVGCSWGSLSGEIRSRLLSEAFIFFNNFDRLDSGECYIIDF